MLPNEERFEIMPAVGRAQSCDLFSEHRAAVERLLITSVPEELRVRIVFYENPHSFSRLVHPPGYNLCDELSCI